MMLVVIVLFFTWYETQQDIRCPSRRQGQVCMRDRTCLPERSREVPTSAYKRDRAGRGRTLKPRGGGRRRETTSLRTHRLGGAHRRTRVVDLSCAAAVDQCAAPLLGH